MFQSRESSWRFPSTLQTILNLLLINLKRSSAKQLKRNRVFDFGSIKKELTLFSTGYFKNTTVWGGGGGGHYDFVVSSSITIKFFISGRIWLTFGSGDKF